MKRNLPVTILISFRTGLAAACIRKLIIILLGLVSNASNAQDVLWGLNSQSGPGGGGTVFSLSLNSTGSYLSSNHWFDDPPATPWSSLIQGPDGAFYGMTAQGGSSDKGTIYRVYGDGNDFTVLKNFNDTDGATPFGSLVLGYDGFLYGMTSTGGSNGYGTIFKIDPYSSGFTVIRNLSYTDGANPHGSLVQGRDAFLYGMAQAGGSNGHGTIFKINTNGSDFSVLKDFEQFTTGASPMGSLVEGWDGAFYGMTYFGGSNDFGTIFKINADGTGFSVLRNLNTADGTFPQKNLMQGSDGFLYGMTETGGSHDKGTIFKVNSEGIFSVIINFEQFTTGSHPLGSLIQDDGFFYGLARQGGNSGRGTVFRMDRDGSGFTVIKNFETTEGGFPVGNLVKGQNGYFYGVTLLGGSSNYGSVFKISADGIDYSTITNFNSVGGANPCGSLVQGSDGAFYGMTTSGGEFGYGTIFKYGNDGYVGSVIKSFNFTDGASPSGSLIQGSNGFLYGMTPSGGTYGYGTIFKIGTDGTGFTVLKNFNYNEGEGGNPKGSLVQGLNGALYGMTFRLNEQRNDNFGTLFKIEVDGSNFTTLRTLNASDGIHPSGRLVQHPNGFLYGATEGGGSDANGTVFKINADGSAFSVIKNFITADGGRPFGSLVLGSDGFFYGITKELFTNSGSVYKISADGLYFSVIKHFSDGNYPIGSLVEGTDGFFYGVTSGPLPDAAAKVFRLSADGTNFSVIRNLNLSEGASPSGGLIIQKCLPPVVSFYVEPAFAGTPTTFIDASTNVAPNATYAWDVDNDGIVDYTTKGRITHTYPMAGTYMAKLTIKQGSCEESFSRVILVNEPEDEFQDVLWGLTSNSGPANGGTSFSLKSSGAQFAVHHSFSFPTGTNPMGNLVQGTDDFFYGMTSAGGSGFGYGTVFKINGDGNNFTKLKDFQFTDGYSPTGSLMQGTDGAFYGMTKWGGSSSFIPEGTGTVFKINKDGSNFTLLHNFLYESDGAHPHGSLIQGSDGMLYGMTFQGGSDGSASGSGTIFKIGADGSGFTVLRNLNSADGRNPEGGLVQGSDGMLYGMATVGGNVGGGTIFKIGADGSGFTVLRNFDNIQSAGGKNPKGSLVQGSDGYFYGMTSQGGSSNGGTVFKIGADGSGFTVIKNFSSADGTSPSGNLVQGSDGYFYGMTSQGGSSNGGTVFKIGADGSGFTVLRYFNAPTDGANPYGSLIVQRIICTAPVVSFTVELGYAGTPITFTDASTNVAPDATYAWDVNNDGIVDYTTKGNITHTYATAGNYAAKLTIKQGSCQKSFSHIVEITAPNTAPVLSAIGNKTINEQKVFSFTVTASDAETEVSSLAFSLANPATGTFPTGATITPAGVFSWTPTENQGPATYRVKVVVSDGALTDEEEIEITVNEVNTAPVLANVPATITVVELVPYSFTATASDADVPTNTLAFSLTGTIPTGAAIDAATGIFSWTPTEEQGNGNTYTFRVRVSDGLLAHEQTVAVTVQEVNTAPVLVAIGSQTVNELTTLSFMASASDADLPANTLTYSLAPAAIGTFPDGATINAQTGEFSWTPTEAQGPGSYIFNVQVSDGTATDQEPITITVNEVNVAPILAAIGDKTVAVGGALGFTVSATDADIPIQTLSYAISLLPGGATFDPGTGAFYWAPAPNQAGTYTITFSASDGVLIDKKTITLTVTGPTPGAAPTITSFSPESGPVGTWVNITGENFIDVAQVTFNDIKAINFTALNTTSIKVRVPTGATSGKISVTTPGGTGKSKKSFTVTTSKTAERVLDEPEISAHIKAYPNPFRDKVTVAFSFDRNEAYTLDVFDVKGSLVKHLQTGKAKAGKVVQATWKPEKTVQGVYIIRLVTQSGVQHLRVVQE